MSGKARFDQSANSVVDVSGAEMRGDDHFILEPIAPLDQIVQMRMAEFVDLVFAMRRGDERQLGDQNSCFVHSGAIVEPFAALSPRNATSGTRISSVTSVPPDIRRSRI